MSVFDAFSNSLRVDWPSLLHEICAYCMFLWVYTSVYTSILKFALHYLHKTPFCITFLESLSPILLCDVLSFEHITIHCPYFTNGVCKTSIFQVQMYEGLVKKSTCGQISFLFHSSLILNYVRFKTFAKSLPFNDFWVQESSKKWTWTFL